jgi:hypothetical protein
MSVIGLTAVASDYLIQLEPLEDWVKIQVILLLPTGKLVYNTAWRCGMNLNEILADIHALEEELLDFERKYGVRSETFYAAYASGEEPEDDSWVLDFGEWASVYKTWLARQADYRNEVQRVQRQARSLAGLIRVAA